MVKMKIVKSNGTATTDTSPVGPVNLVLFSMFSSIKIFFNDYLVGTDQNPGYQHWLHYITMSDSKKQSVGSLAMYYEDNMNSESTCGQSNPYSVVNNNQGLKVIFLLCQSTPHLLLRVSSSSLKKGNVYF